MAGFLSKVTDYAMEKLGKIEKPEADVEDVDLKDMTRECVTYDARVAITNPYSHDIPICEVSYSLKSTNKVIASGTMADPGSLVGDNITKLNVPLKVPYHILMTLAKDIGADWDIDYELELGLTFDLPIIGNFTLPLTNKGTIKLPTFSDLF